MRAPRTDCGGEGMVSAGVGTCQRFAADAFCSSAFLGPVTRGDWEGVTLTKSSLKSGHMNLACSCFRDSMQAGAQARNTPCWAAVCIRSKTLPSPWCVECVVQWLRCVRGCLRYLWKRLKVDPQGQHGHHNHQGHKETCHLQNRNKSITSANMWVFLKPLWVFPLLLLQPMAQLVAVVF